MPGNSNAVRHWMLNIPLCGGLCMTPSSILKDEAVPCAWVKVWVGLRLDFGVNFRLLIVVVCVCAAAAALAKALDGLHSTDENLLSFSTEHEQQGFVKMHQQMALCVLSVHLQKDTQTKRPMISFVMPFQVNP